MLHQVELNEMFSHLLIQKIKYLKRNFMFLSSLFIPRNNPQ